MDGPLAAAVGAALGSPVARSAALGGGDINAAWSVTLADGRRAFVKSNRRAPAGMFSAEARGLAWLAAAGALRVPGVLAIRDEAPAFLALELLTPGRRVRGFDDRLGRGLAALHRAHPTGFGLDHDNYIGRLPQRNEPRPTWAELYRDMRIAPQVRLATDAGQIDGALRRDLDRVMARLDSLVGPPEPPCRLHGDLWGGNLHVDDAGEPCLIDPAVYGGHRETDLAMMRLFGGFSARVFAAYDEAFPLAPGHLERVSLHQLYPLLVHVNLFGGGYAGQVARAARAYL